MYYIYQRISTEKQSLIRQESVITEYCQTNNIEVAKENVFSDIITGKTIKRENYQLMKTMLKKDDILIIQSLDRLGRNWDLIKKEWQDLTKQGIYIIVIDCPLINALPDNKGEISIDRRLIQEMMFTLLCYVSQKEVEKISTRTKDALRAKKEVGIILGRPKTYSNEFREEVVGYYKQGNSMEKTAKEFGISSGTVYRFVKECE
jgi:DNA invertase Pin-like site-specific DNA recombinase